VLRRFVGRKHKTRWINEMWEAIGAITETRRGMRAALREFNPELAENLSETQAARLYNFAQGMADVQRRIKRTIETITESSDLTMVQEVAEGWGHGVPQLARREGDWNDLPALKMHVIDSLLEERARLAKDFGQRLRSYDPLEQ
jgi:hypothetical protein